jgi:hypothetical protein
MFHSLLKYTAGSSLLSLVGLVAFKYYQDLNLDSFV